MSDFANGFCMGYAVTRRPFGMLSLYGGGFYGGGLYGAGYAREAVLGSPLIYSCYADLDSPSGLSSPFPAVNYAINSPHTASLSDFSYSSFGFGGFGGFGYFC